jgi:S-adenosylmethionine:tRNA ribosyltransferase-isomerase
VKAAASHPVQRPRDARLLVIDEAGRPQFAPRSRLVEFLRPGDLVIANDAATLPASLHGTQSQRHADRSATGGSTLAARGRRA